VQLKFNNDINIILVFYIVVTKMKNITECYTIGTVLKTNQKSLKDENSIYTPNTHIYGRS